MKCTRCGTPAIPVERLNNYELTLALFYRRRDCCLCHAPLCDNYDEFLREFAKRLDSKEKK